MRLAEIFEISDQQRIAKEKKQEAKRQAEEAKASHPQANPKTEHTAPDIRGPSLNAVSLRCVLPPSRVQVEHRRSLPPASTP